MFWLDIYEVGWSCQVWDLEHYNSLPMTDPCMYAILMDPHLPSIYPSHVSIFLTYDWIRHGLYNRTLDDLPDPQRIFGSSNVIEPRQVKDSLWASAAASATPGVRAPRASWASWVWRQRGANWAGWLSGTTRSGWYNFPWRIQSYGIYANMNGDIWGILMVNVTPYMAYMDPMGYEMERTFF